MTEEERRKKLLEGSAMLRGEREKDMELGRARGEEFFKEGSLGRLSENRSADISNIVNMRKNIAEKGFGAEAFQKSREAAFSGMDRAQQLQARKLKGMQGSAGLQGGLAGSQQMDLMRQQQNERQNVERQLFLDNIAQRQSQIGASEQSIRSAENQELANKQYNIQQRKDEIMGLLTAQFGEAGMGIQERGQLSQNDLAKDYANAIKNQKTGKK